MLRFLIFTFLLFSISFIAAKNSNDSIPLASIQKLNSRSNETHPLVSPDGQRFYFVRENHDLNIGTANKNDIWVANKNSDGSWSTPVNMGFPVNNEENNTILGVALDGSTLYFTNGQTIFFTQKKGRVWSTPKELNLKAKSLKPIQGYVSVDEKIVVLSLENEQSMGSTDLFVSLKAENGDWSSPINLGLVVNSKNEENNAFLAADNRTLYFCSNGKKGFGASDWFSTQRLDDTWQNWSAPKNLGESINTSQDDVYFSFTFDGKEAYTSQKTGNDWNIRGVKMDLPSSAENVVLIKGKIKYSEGQNMASMPLKWQALHQNKSYSGFQSDSDGNFQVLLSNDLAFGFYGQDKKHFSALTYINFDENPLKKLDFDYAANKKNRKDSLNQHRSEELIIRIGQLNSEVTQLSEEGFSPKEKNKQIGKKEEQQDFSTDRDLEKLKNNFEKKDKIKNTNTTSSTTRATSIEDENANTITSDEEQSAIRKLFAQYQSIKKIEKNNQQNNSNTEISPNDDRAAIDDLVALEGVDEKRQFADFQALSLKIRQDISDEILSEIKFALYKDATNNWSNWALLKVSIEEQRLLSRLILDKKKVLIKQFEQVHKERMAGMKIKKTNSYEQIERNLYNVLLPQVRNELLTNQKEFILQEVDWNLNFLLKNALRSEFQEELQKRVERQLNTEKITLKSSFSSKKYVPQTHNESTKNIILEFFPLQKEQMIPLNGIFFKENESQLLPESQFEIIRLKKLMDENSTLKIAIQAHTHGEINFETAQRLTVARSSVVKDALVKLGIDAERITTNGYGKFAPLNPNDSAENRYKNQRIEFKILFE